MLSLYVCVTTFFHHRQHLFQHPISICITYLRSLSRFCDIGYTVSLRRCSSSFCSFRLRSSLGSQPCFQTCSPSLSTFVMMNAFGQGNATPIVFDIGKCRATIDDLNMMNPGLGLPYKLPLQQCEQYCGKGYGPYGFYDALDAIITWVIPLLALAANMNFTETTKLRLPYGSKVFVIAHQFANPIDTIFSLASKLDLGQRLREHCDSLNLAVLPLEKDELANAKRDIANVCYCMDDFGHDRFEKRAKRIFELVQSQCGADIVRSIKTASRDLALARVRNILRTSIAVVVFVGAAFTARLKTNTASGLGFAHPHTIALRELCYFLLLEIVLSAAAEGWPHQWTPQSPLNTLGGELHQHDPQFGWQSLGRKEIEPWNGGIYSYRPQKNLPWRRSDRNATQNKFHSTSGDGSGRHKILLALAFLSVLVAFSISFMMSWYTPTVGLGGRGIAELTYVSVWIVNFVFENWMASRVKEKRLLFHLVWIKDTLVSFLVILFFLLPFMGKF